MKPLNLIHALAFVTDMKLKTDLLGKRVTSGNGERGKTRGAKKHRYGYAGREMKKGRMESRLEYYCVPHIEDVFYNISTPIVSC